MSENRLQEALDILWCDPVANERARLEREVIEAAKKWHSDVLDGDNRQGLFGATNALIDFESSR